jgi:hypothetical protein
MSSNKEYHDFLQFLYFEGYADSYAEAEELFESLDDNEIEELNEARRQAHSFPLKPSERRSVSNIARMNRGDFSVPPNGSVRIKSAKKQEPEPEPKKNKPRRRGVQNVQYNEFDLVSDYLFNEGYADSPESAEVMAENISGQWIQSILSESDIEVYSITEAPFQIYGPDPHGSSDSESRPIGKPYKNKKRAKNRADRLDQEIGGYRHSVRYVDEAYQDLTPEKEERVRNRVGELARDIQVQGARMKDLKKKPFGRFRPKVKKEKEEIVKSARKKANLVSNASDALIRTSTSRSATIQKRIQDLKNQS